MAGIISCLCYSKENVFEVSLVSSLVVDDHLGDIVYRRIASDTPGYSRKTVASLTERFFYSEITTVGYDGKILVPNDRGRFYFIELAVREQLL